MDIVIISEFCEDFSLTDNDRFLYLARMLAENHTVELITSSFRHTTKSHRRSPAAEWPFRITFLEEPGYPKNVCLQRFASHRIWGRNVRDYLASRTKPDVVYCAVPSLTAADLAAKYCEKEQVPFVVDIQDLWPEAFQMVVDIPILSAVAFAPFTALASGSYRRADAVCAVSDTYAQRALRVNKKCRASETVYLGTELNAFDRYASEEPVLKKKKDEIWLAYCGTLGASYDLPCVIDALALLDDDSLRLIVMGDGPRIDEFRHYADEKRIRAEFMGRLPYDRLCSQLCACDMTVNPIVRNAAQSIINKHADYAASGLPVVSTQESEEYRSLIETYHMGLNCRSGDAADLAEKIRRLADDEALRKEMGRNARRCAEERFDRKESYQNLCRVILSAAKKEEYEIL